MYVKKRGFNGNRHRINFGKNLILKLSQLNEIITVVKRKKIKFSTFTERGKFGHKKS